MPRAQQPDLVNQPPHYLQNLNGIECIDAVEDLPFNAGNAVKYLWRYQFKGNPISDLEKAKWYVEREISRLQRDVRAGRR